MSKAVRGKLETPFRLLTGSERIAGKPDTEVQMMITSLSEVHTAVARSNSSAT